MLGKHFITELNPFPESYLLTDNCGFVKEDISGVVGGVDCAL